MTELNLKRAVISCLDTIGSEANRLEIEDIVAKAADNAPVDELAVKLLRKGMFIYIICIYICHGSHTYVLYLYRFIQGNK